MPFLPGGYHLPLAQKIAISNASLMMMVAELLDDEEGWEDNLKDTGAILQFAGTLYVLWIPPVVQGAIAARVGILLAPLAVPAAIVTSAIVVGGIVSYFVDPEEGLQNYKDFLTEPDILTDPRKREALGQAADIVLSLVNPLHIPTKWAAENLPWNQIFRNRWVTGPYLPF